MNRLYIKLGAFLLALFTIVVSPMVYAQATRTWVSGVGDDANPCSRTAPCKTFAGAISKTAAGGEINAIDSGGFGTLTITKSIVIDGNGVHASMLSSGVNGILVNAGAGDVIVIRNVSINGAGVGGPTGLNGIRFLAGKELHVENVVIQNFLQKGIDVESTTSGSQLFVRDSIIRDAADAVNGGGILVKPGVGGSVTVSLDNVRMDRNKFGLRIEDNVKAFVRNSIASNSPVGNGFVAATTAAAAEMFIENSSVEGNATNGVIASGNNAIIRLSNVSIFNNASSGINAILGGQVISFGNNKNANTAPGAPTSTVLQQ